MPREETTELKIGCNNCRKQTNKTDIVYSASALPIKIVREGANRYKIECLCLKCGKLKGKTLNRSQRYLLPKEILDIPIGSTFEQYSGKQGGLLPLPILLPMIFGGIELASHLIEPATNLIKKITGNSLEVESQNNSLEAEEIRDNIRDVEIKNDVTIPLEEVPQAHSLEAEEVKNGGIIPLALMLPMIMPSLIKSITQITQGKGINVDQLINHIQSSKESQGGYLPIATLLPLIFQGISAVSSLIEPVSNVVKNIFSKKGNALDIEEMPKLSLDEAIKIIQGHGLNIYIP